MGHIQWLDSVRDARPFRRIQKYRLEYGSLECQSMETLKGTLYVLSYDRMKHSICLMRKRIVERPQSRSKREISSKRERDISAIYNSFLIRTRRFDFYEGGWSTEKNRKKRKKNKLKIKRPLRSI